MLGKPIIGFKIKSKLKKWPSEKIKEYLFRHCKIGKIKDVYHAWIKLPESPEFAYLEFLKRSGEEEVPDIGQINFEIITAWPRTGEMGALNDPLDFSIEVYAHFPSLKFASIYIEPEEYGFHIFIFESDIDQKIEFKKEEIVFFDINKEV